MPSPILLRSLVVVTMAAVPDVALAAPDLSNWRSIPAPTGVSGIINAIGTTASYLTANAAHFYSGITKTWVAVPLSGPPSFFETYNSYIVLRDGNQIHGFATRTGQVETITTSPGAVILSGPISSSWVTLVADGTQAWGFSGFRGEWVPLTLAQPNPTMATRRYCGLIQDGTTVYGFSAHWGTFVPVAADAQTAILVNEEVGSAHSPGVFRAFSVHQNTWGVKAFATTGIAALPVGYAIAASGTSVLVFSGLTGEFASYAAQAPVTGIQTAEMVATFQDGANAVCYSAGQGNFGTVQAPGASLVFDYEMVLVQEANQVTPFSAITGDFGTPISGTFNLDTNDVIAYADRTAGMGPDYAYSAILNAWTAAPAVTEVLPPILVRSAVVIPHTGGYEALSARHGTWVAQPTQQTGVVTAPGNTSTIFIEDLNNVMYVFDSRLNRFARQDGLGTGTLLFAVNRHTAIAYDNDFAYGFSQPTGRWDVVPLSGQPVAVFDIASSIGFVETATELHVYSAQGSFSYEARFPEFSRATKLGNPLRLHQVAAPGSNLVLLIGPEPTWIDLGDSGILFIEPTTLFPIAIPVPVPASGVLHLEFPLPKNPVLVGLQPQLQNIVFPPAEAPYLSTSVSPILY